MCVCVCVCVCVCACVCMGDVCRMCMCVCGVLVSPNSGDKADQRFWGLKASLMILLCPRVCVYVMIDKDSHMCLQGVFWSAPCVCSGCSLMLLCAHRSLFIHICISVSVFSFPNCALYDFISR